MTLLEHFSWKQQASIVVIAKISSLFSIAGSLRILITISKKWRQHGSDYSTTTPANSIQRRCTDFGVSMKERFLVGISVADILASIAYFWGTWAFPEETEVWGAVGNSTTCKASGVLRGMGLLVFPYGMATGLYFYVAIKHGRQGIQRVQHYEKHIHGSIILFGIALVAVCFYCGSYQGRTYVCFASYDRNSCDPDSTQCYREYSGNRWWYPILFAVPIFSTYFGSMCFVPLIYYNVRQKESEMYRYASSQSRSNALRAVAVQGFLYMGTLLVCSVPPILNNFVFWMSTPARPNYVLTVFTAILEPLQGFLNMIVYHRTIATDASSHSGKSQDNLCFEEMEHIETMEYELKEAMNFAFNFTEPNGGNHLGDSILISRDLSLEAINIKKKNTLRLCSDLFTNPIGCDNNLAKDLDEEGDRSDTPDDYTTVTASKIQEEQESNYNHLQQESKKGDFSALCHMPQDIEAISITGDSDEITRGGPAQQESANIDEEA